MELMLSFMHTQPTVGDTGKPEVIEFYNVTKGVIDTFDPMCAYYSCRRKTKQLLLCVFYGMLNASCINSWIIHIENVNKTGGKELPRRKYMHELAYGLIKPWAQKRFSFLFLSRTLSNLICTVCKFPSPSTAADTPGTSAAES